MNRGRPPKHLSYRTSRGFMVHGASEDILSSPFLKRFYGKVQLVFTSPPFPLNKKKSYGNLQGPAYVKWLAGFGPQLISMLRPDGSLVIELGNSWEPGIPAMSTLALEALLALKEQNNLYLCQEFICHNPARLPSPVQWVNKERIRLKDSYTRLWWLSTTPRPKANNKNVLMDYSPAMRSLLKSGKYNPGKRPSEHVIGRNSFLKDHGGSIPPSVLAIANTTAKGEYLDYCKSVGLTPHPARMPVDLARFFIKFLTSENDLVLDPFAGSNTTGAAAEELGRRWISIEPDHRYIRGSLGRFLNNNDVGICEGYEL